MAGRTGRRVYDGQPDHVLAKMRLWEVEDDDGELAVEVDPDPDVCNPHGSPHASVMAALIDCGAARVAVAAAGTENIAGSDLTVRFINRVKVGPARTKARVLKAGRRAVVVQVDVIDVGDDRRLVATATMSFARLDGAT